MFHYKSILTVFTLSLFFNACNQKIDKKIQTKESKTQNTLPPIPEEMYFAGERIILKDWDIRERLDREILVNTYFQSSTSLIIKRSHRWFPLLEKLLKKSNIHPDFKYLAVIESALVEKAISNVGAQGFWQFMPFTAKEFNLTMNEEVDERLDVFKSTIAACDYLKKANHALNDWILTAASYNRGIHGILKDKTWQNAKSYFDLEQNDETARYVFRILAIKLILENPEKYGFNIPFVQRYPPLKVNPIQIKKSISNLSEWALTKGINFKILRKLNPWIKTTKLTIKNKYYTLLLPLNTENLKPYHNY
ncbi:MAG: lytic transglycosylase domain-containing protein [Crocinitomicaceae bacterium]|jgi:membrane-bound lytic murein transglycosylase D